MNPRAHGLGGNVGDATTADFVQLGFNHMLQGWDHLLFVLGVILITRTWRRAAKMISLFALGHSITLIVATLAGYGLPAGLVDLIIAFSVVVVAMLGLSGRAMDWRRFGAMIFGFGLIHGLGLASRLLEFDLPSDGLLLKVIAFNVGVELGQLTAIAGYALVIEVGLLLLKRVPERLTQLAQGGVGIGGGVAMFVVLLGILNPTVGRPTYVDIPRGSDCTINALEREFSSVGGTHPDQVFTEPGQKAPMNDFGHTVLDGFLILLYPRDLAPEEVDGLREYVNGPDGEFVLAGPDPDESDRIEVYTAQETLSCGELDLELIKRFREEWLDIVAPAVA
ncbi:MAG: HupE/UreJ family protein [Nocardioides sp.]